MKLQFCELELVFAGNPYEMVVAPVPLVGVTELLKQLWAFVTVQDSPVGVVEIATNPLLAADVAEAASGASVMPPGLACEMGYNVDPDSIFTTMEPVLAGVPGAAVFALKI